MAAHVCYADAMARFFNTAGVCEPRDHYMLPPQQRLPSLGSLIAKKAYFVVHAPRQSGKSTCFHHLARELTAAGRYAALLTTCETARTVSGDVDRAVNVIVRAIETDARTRSSGGVAPAAGRVRASHRCRDAAQLLPRDLV